MAFQSNQPIESDERLACVLALFLAAKGRIDDVEWRALDQADLCRHLGVSRDRFVELTAASVKDFGEHLRTHQWLSAEDIARIDQILVPIVDGVERLKICYFATLVFGAEGHLTHYKRLVYDHALACWHLTPAAITAFGVTMSR